MKVFLFVIIICLAVLACNRQAKSGGPKLVPNDDELIDSQESFVRNYEGRSDTLFAFVGEKIAVEKLPSEKNSMDYSFKAKYSVLKSVYGHFRYDTIEFIVYDHYGEPAFSKFKDVLLYVSADSGTYYLQKYMYNDVYLTQDGRWAGSYAKDDYEHSYNEKTTIKPVRIDFAEEVFYPTVFIHGEDTFNLEYPEPYFKTVENKAFAVYGNYVDELFQLKRDGVLTARKLFER